MNTIRKISQNPEYVQTHCNDRKIIFILHVVNDIYKKFHNVDIV